MRRQYRGRRLEYPNNMQEEAFIIRFPIVVQDDINQGIDVSLDVQALLMPPLRNVKSYKSMYAYGNHISGPSVESNMHTCDNGVAATFLQAVVRATDNKFKIHRMGGRNNRGRLWRV